MKKKPKDPGLIYLEEIGFKRSRGKYGLNRRFNEVFGPSRGEQLYKTFLKFEGRSPEFYDFKNSDPDISKCFSEAYDGDIFRSACNYIASHGEYFGKTILEVGCDTGYMTGFLAKSFPNSKIVSIDRNEAAIKLAKSRIDSMNIKNVQFLNCSLEDITDEYDTVFCMRTIQENRDKSVHAYEGEVITFQFDQCARLTAPYTKQLLSRLKSHGYLCVFERVGHDPLMCGWLLCLNNNECGLISSSYSEYICEEAGGSNTFQAFVSEKGSLVPEKEIIDLWYKAIGVNPTGKAQLSGWNALVYLLNNAGPLIHGIRVLGDEDLTVGRFALFHDNDDESLLYLLWAAGEDISLLSYNISLQDDLLSQIQNAKTANLQAGLKVVSIDPDDEILEGNY